MRDFSTSFVVALSSFIDVVCSTFRKVKKQELAMYDGDCKFKNFMDEPAWEFYRTPSTLCSGEPGGRSASHTEAGLRQTYSGLQVFNAQMVGVY